MDRQNPSAQKAIVLNQGSLACNKKNDIFTWDIKQLTNEAVIMILLADTFALIYRTRDLSVGKHPHGKLKKHYTNLYKISLLINDLLQLYLY